MSNSPNTTGDRLIKAISSGWGFKYLQYAPYATSRHSLYVSPPKQEGWVCHKVDGAIPDNKALEALLNEAGVPS